MNTTTFSAINTILLRPLPVTRPGQLVSLNRRIHASAPTLSYPDYRGIRDRNTVLSGLTAYRFLPASLSKSGNSNRVWGYLATGNYFDVLGVDAVRGSLFTARMTKSPAAVQWWS